MAMVSVTLGENAVGRVVVGQVSRAFEQSTKSATVSTGLLAIQNERRNHAYTAREDRRTDASFREELWNKRLPR